MYSGEVVEEGTINSPVHVASTLHHGLFGCIPRTRTRPRSGPSPGNCLSRTSGRAAATLGPRCDFFQDGRCDAKDVAMESVAGAAMSDHRVRCLRWREIDHGKDGRARRGEGTRWRSGDAVLAVEDMQKYYEVRDRSIRAILAGTGTMHVKANEQLNFDARRGETVAIVGESGCGKSTFAKVLMGLETATDGPEFRHDGNEISRSRCCANARRNRFGSLQMVFQNPFDTLNPKPYHRGPDRTGHQEIRVETDKRKIQERVLKLLDIVKLPRDFYIRRPRQLSAGRSSVSASPARSPATPRW